MNFTTNKSICLSTAYEGAQTFHIHQYRCEIQDGVIYSLQTWDKMYFGLYSIPKLNIGSHLHRCNSVWVHPNAHPQHMKVLKLFIWIHHRCEIQSGVVYSLQTWHHDVIWAMQPPNFQNWSYLQRCKCVRVHPYAHLQHTKLLKHFQYNTSNVDARYIVG